MRKSYTKSQLILFTVIFCISGFGYVGMYIRGLKFLAYWFLVCGFLCPVGMCFYSHIKDDE